MFVPIRFPGLWPDVHGSSLDAAAGKEQGAATLAGHRAASRKQNPLLLGHGWAHAGTGPHSLALH